MSHVSLHHYQNGNSPKIHEINNASAFVSGLVKLIGDNGAFLRNDDSEAYTRAYNAFQRSNAPDWKKIAAGFLSNYTLVLDEDRSEVADALKKAFGIINEGGIEPSIRNVADKLIQINEGPIVVTPYDRDPQEFLYQKKINIAVFRDSLQEYIENPTRREIEDLLGEHEVEVAVPVENVLRISRAVIVPRFWKEAKVNSILTS